MLQIDVVTCRLNGRVYVRKSTEKPFALRARDVRLSGHLIAFRADFETSYIAMFSPVRTRHLAAGC
jgi:hypothetical protein